MQTPFHEIGHKILADGKPVPEHRPWPRIQVDHATWILLGKTLGEGKCRLLALWADAQEVHAAILGLPDAVTILSVRVQDGGYPALTPDHLPALRLERTIRDMHGHVPFGLLDDRPWLNHGVWLRPPRPEAPPCRLSAPTAYPFLPIEGESLHQIPVGPVHAGIIEPGHFRFTANGEAVVRLEERLGYVHKGVEQLLEGKDLAEGSRICGRISGDSTVAYAIAYARAVEAALHITPSSRAHHLRALMAELERMANHCGDIGFICNDAAFSILQANFSILREEILQSAQHCFGHRLMMDRVVPGGVTVDLPPDGTQHLTRFLDKFEKRFEHLMTVYDSVPSLLDRTRATGILTTELARQFAPGGFIGRASGRRFDARRHLPYPPYDSLQFALPIREEGDVHARLLNRADEVRQSAGLIRQILANPGKGPLTVPVAFESQEGGHILNIREGCGVAEAFRGDVFIWLRIGADGKIMRCHPRDPSWFQWPLLEACIEGNIVADFPLCNKSFNCSYSGHDL
ncbi:MAG: nickel-dependent hydrogenase large subunit [Magnetococcus sp. DMHC-1]|nr:nickel-dependent hydrogenase large subunit [Magnetococcales bacterium]